MIVMKLVAMHDAVAATEVVYYASNKLDENAMHQEGPVLLLLYVGNRQKAESDERTSGSMVRLFSVFGWRRVVLSLSAPSN